MSSMPADVVLVFVGQQDGVQCLYPFAQHLVAKVGAGVDDDTGICADRTGVHGMGRLLRQFVGRSLFGCRIETFYHDR